MLKDIICNAIFVFLALLIFEIITHKKQVVIDADYCNFKCDYEIVLEAKRKGIRSYFLSEKHKCKLVYNEEYKWWELRIKLKGFPTECVRTQDYQETWWIYGK